MKKSVIDISGKECRDVPWNVSTRVLGKRQGYDDAYRIRVGDYRIGIIFNSETLIFQRVLHRKEIYRYFPT